MAESVDMSGMWQNVFSGNDKKIPANSIVGQSAHAQKR